MRKYKKFTKHVRNVVFYNESSNISITSSNTEPHINDVYNTEDLFRYEIEMHLSVLEHKCYARLGPKKNVGLLTQINQKGKLSHIKITHLKLS